MDVVVIAQPNPEEYELITSGARPRLGAELRVVVSGEWAVQVGELLLRESLEDILRASPTGRHSMWWGFRQVLWVRTRDWWSPNEYDQARRPKPGAQDAITAFAAQHWVCARYGASFAPARDDQLVAASPRAVTSAREVEGTRYDLGPSHTGWIIIEAGFQGDVSELVQQHAYEFLSVRPELERFFGLPFGWRFFRNDEGEHVATLESDDE